MSTPDLLQSQTELIDAIFSNSGATTPNTLTVRERRGLSVYQQGLFANARRALEISFPTVYELLGDDAFSVVSAALLNDYPFCEGDWGVWGANLPSWLAQAENLESYPYLEDVAVLDWACHSCERAADVELDMASLQSLASADPYQVRLKLGVGVSLIRSGYPIVDIWQAHQGESEAAQAALAQAKENLQSDIGQAALVWRPAWKANVKTLNAGEERWLHIILQGCSLGEALDQMQGDTFSFETWLPAALDERVVVGIGRHSE